MRHRTAGLDHQAGSLLPELRGVLLTLARHTDNLPAGPAVPPVRCPPSRVNPRQPLWLKVSYMAYSRVGANGCAPFPKREELAKLLGKRRQDIDRAIRTAIGYGFLEEASCAECVRPPGFFVGFAMGISRKECAV